MLKVEVKGNLLVVEIPLQQPVMSSTGKSMVVASTGGFVQTNAQVNGKPIKLNVSGIIKP